MNPATAMPDDSQKNENSNTPPKSDERGAGPLPSRGATNPAHVDARQDHREHGDSTDELSPRAKGQDSEFSQADETLLGGESINPLPFPKSVFAGGSSDAMPYEILGILGQGGMGTVYKARQKSLGRIVALKTVDAGRELDSERLNRFRIEAEAVAKLQHPNIVQVYEAGQWGGSPCLLLEYVADGSLADKFQGEQFSPDVAARFVEVLARATHFAHQNGIIHRDLKPANILLTRRGQIPTGGRGQDDLQHFDPKITDFGLAKHLEGQSHTRTGIVMGTPSYMAPEQASGIVKQIGPLCDVYSMGAIFYELLTGRPPFCGQDTTETLFQVLTEEPIAPRRLVGRVSRDCENVCLKCLEKSPKHRYDSAESLADDLHRLVEHRPVLARPAGPIRRLGKWVRRRPGVAALSAICVAAVLAALLVSLFYNRWISQALADAKQAQSRAEHNFSLAEFAVESMLTEVATEDLALVPGMDRVRRSVMRRALGFYENFMIEQGDDPEVRLRAARGYGQVARINALLDDFPPAIQASEKERQLLEQLRRDYPKKHEYTMELAAAFNNAARIEMRMGKLDASKEHFDRAVKLCEIYLSLLPKDLEGMKLLALIHNNLAVLLRPQDLGEAEIMYRRTQNIRLQLLEAQPDDGQLKADLAITLNNLAALLVFRGNHDEALHLFEYSIKYISELPPSLAEKLEVRQTLAGAWSNLGRVHSQRNERELGETAFRKAVDQFTDLASDFPTVPAILVAQTEAELNLVVFLAGCGEFDQARAIADKAINSSERLLGIPGDRAEYRMLHLTRLALAAELAAQIGRADDLKALQLRFVQSLAAARETKSITAQGLKSLAIFTAIAELPEFKAAAAEGQDK